MQGNRYLSFPGALALSFGYAVGWGAFVLPGTMFLPGAGPVGAIVGFLIGTLAIAVLAFNFHKVTTSIQGSGGTYGFIAKVFGQNHGFLMGWFLFLTLEACFVRYRQVDRRIAFAALCFNLPFPVSFAPFWHFHVQHKGIPEPLNSSEPSI